MKASDIPILRLVEILNATKGSLGPDAVEVKMFEGELLRRDKMYRQLQDAKEETDDTRRV